MRHRPAITAWACAVTLFAITGTALGTAPATPTLRLHALFDRAWERDLNDDPLGATSFGDRRFNDRWPDLARANLKRIHAADVAVLADLQQIPRAALPPAEQINYDLFQHEYEDRNAAWPFHLEAYIVNGRSGAQTLNEVSEVMPLDTVADYDTWLRRLASLPLYLRQTQDLLSDAIRDRRTQPRLLMERALAQFAAQVVAKPEDSPFYQRFRSLPETFPAAERDRLQAAARKVITEAVVPAYRTFDRFFREQYVPACRETSGLWDTPDGAAFYQNRIQYFTTTKLTADQIHEIGLREVARIRGEMQQVMEQIGFKGTLQEFFVKLRGDPQFYYSTPDDLFKAYVVTAKQIEPELPKLFGRLYRTPFGVRPIPMTSAPNTTTAYYMPPSDDGRRAGYYYVNLYRPEVRPKYEIEVLTSHESVPGHHLQIALGMELGELPTFRRQASYTAFVEGWALYSERLGYDLGLYKDPYSRFGQLTYDMWRAVRLVVDTGIHARHWTRQQAIEYFKDNAAKTEADIVNEIDRYIGNPGQALAYKIGQLKILELRAAGEHDLGPKFDIRAFHDVVLGSGAVPLDTLERNVRAWIAAQGAKAPPQNTAAAHH